MDSDPFPASDFDEWAPTYDADTASNIGFPFERYDLVLKTVFEAALVEPDMRVLDLGAGTGNLTALFARAGCEVWGTDYSPEMLLLARKKLPGVRFVQADIRDSWSPALPQVFDRIVSGYAFHHFPQAQKVALIVELARRHLSPAGRIVIADIAFPSADHQAAVKKDLGDAWDDEFYWIADADIPALTSAGLLAAFDPVSASAGVFTVEMLE